MFALLRPQCLYVLAFHVDAQYFAIEEHQCVKCLVLRRGRRLSLNSQIGQELFDLCFSHLDGVAFVVVENVMFDPANIAFFRFDAVMLDPDLVTRDIE